MTYWTKLSSDKSLRETKFTLPNQNFVNLLDCLFDLVIHPVCYRLVASALFYSLLGVGTKIPPQISETTGHPTMNFLPDVKYSEEAQNQKNLTKLDWSVNYRPKSRKTRFLEMQLLGMLTSRNFAGFLILTSKINPENFRSISQR